MTKKAQDSAPTRALSQHLDAKSTGRIVVGQGPWIAVHVQAGALMAAESSEDSVAYLRRLRAEGALPESRLRDMQAFAERGEPIFGDLLDLVAPAVMDRVLVERFRDNLAGFVGSSAKPQFEASAGVFVDNLQLGLDVPGEIRDACAAWNAQTTVAGDMPLYKGGDKTRNEREAKVLATLKDGMTVSALLARIQLEPIAARASIAQMLATATLRLRPPTLATDEEAGPRRNPSRSPPGPLVAPPVASDIVAPPAPVKRTMTAPPPPAVKSVAPRTPDANDFDDLPTLQTQAVRGPVPVLASDVPAAPVPDVDEADSEESLIEHNADDVTEEASRVTPARRRTSQDESDLFSDPEEDGSGEPIGDLDLEEPVSDSPSTDGPASDLPVEDEAVSDETPTAAVDDDPFAEDAFADEPVAAEPPADRPSEPVNEEQFDEPVADPPSEGMANAIEEAFGRTGFDDASRDRWLERTKSAPSGDEMDAFADYDEDRGGGGQGKFSTQSHNLDRVDVSVGEADEPPPPPPEEEAIEAGDLPQAKFGAPTLTEDESAAKVEIANETLAHIIAAFDADQGAGAGRSHIQLLIEGSPAQYAPLLADLQTDEDTGAIPVDSLLQNLYARPAFEQRRLLNDGLVDLIERALSFAAEDLSDEAIDAMLEATAGYRGRMGR